MSKSSTASFFMRSRIVSVGGLLVAGCATASTYHPVPSLPAQTVAAEAARPGGELQMSRLVQASHEPAQDVHEPLTLERLLALAEANNPSLAAVRARADAARGKLIQAGLYPNPTVGWEADQLGDKANGAGEQGPVFEQEIVTGGKLQLAQEAAAHGVTAADWQAITRWFEVVTQVRTVYYELIAAQREARELELIVRQIEDFLKKAEKSAEVGLGAVLPADALRIRVELRQNQDRLGSALEREKAARQLLAAAIGLPELPIVKVEGKLEPKAPVYELGPVRAAVLTQHSQVLETQASVLQAEAELRLAQAQLTPNLQFRVRPFYDFPEDRQKVVAEVGMPLPVFNRNQGNILSAQADIARSQAEVRQAQVRLAERLAEAFRRYQNARRQVDLYEKQILPDAQKALDQVRQLYETRGERFLDVLDAQRTLNQARLEFIRAQGDLWQGVTEIEGLLQRGRTP